MRLTEGRGGETASRVRDEEQDSAGAFLAD
jgi:hypothetical protein